MLIGKYPFLPRLRSERIGGPSTKTILLSNFCAALSKWLCRGQWERLTLTRDLLASDVLVPDSLTGIVSSFDLDTDTDTGADCSSSVA